MPLQLKEALWLIEHLEEMTNRNARESWHSEIKFWSDYISTQCVTDAILIIYNNNKNNKETNAFSQKDNKKALFFYCYAFCDNEQQM